MPDLASPLQIASGGGAVSPILGNENVGGACYAGNSQALYAVPNNGNIEVWRTRSGLQALWLEDASVDYLATIAAGPFDTPTSVALTRIEGTAYASVAARLSGTAGAWHRVYRDTSAAADGSGPWVVHGVITSAATFGDPFVDGGYAAGELYVTAAGTWLTSCTIYGPGYAGILQAAMGVATSADAGATWTIHLRTPADRFGLSAVGCGRNFTTYNGNTYWSWASDYGFDTQGHVYESSDLGSWTDLGSLGNTAGVACYTFPASAPGVIYRLNPANAQMEYAQAAPEGSPEWTPVLDLSPIPGSGPSPSAVPLLCQVGLSNRPAWVVTNKGKVLAATGLSGGMPPCRQYPREDARGMSSASRIYPQPRSQQGGIRRGGGTYY